MWELKTEDSKFHIKVQSVVYYNLQRLHVKA